MAAAQAGTKVTTIRSARRVKSIEAGVELALAFGNYAGPTMVAATCTGKRIITPAEAGEIVNAHTSYANMVAGTSRPVRTEAWRMAVADGIGIGLMIQMLTQCAIGMARGDLAVISFRIH